MRLLLAALGSDVKVSGKNYTARCPVHGDRDFAMSIKQNPDGSVMAHCFACGANGLDLYKHLGLDLDELFGGREQTGIIPPQARKSYEDDKWFMAVYNSDIKRGFKPSYRDERRKKLAVARMEGIEKKYGCIN